MLFQDFIIRVNLLFCWLYLFWSVFCHLKNHYNSAEQPSIELCNYLEQIVDKKYCLFIKCIPITLFLVMVVNILRLEKFKSWCDKNMKIWFFVYPKLFCYNYPPFNRNPVVELLKPKLLKKFQKCYGIGIFKIVKGMILFMTPVTQCYAIVQLKT